MTQIDITIPFQRTYTLEGGRTRRTIEDLAVSLRDVKVSTLVQAARTSGGALVLEHEGLELSYIGDTRSTSSKDAFFQGMDMRARYGGGKPPLREYGTVPRKGVTDDGKADLSSRIAEVEAGYVVVDGCVGRVGISPGTNITLQGGHPWRGREAFPWLTFPIARQDEAASVAEAMRHAFAGTLPNVEVVDAATYEILDAAAVERMAARSDAVGFSRWGVALVRTTRDVLGYLDSDAAHRLLALRDASESEAPDEELLPLIREAVNALSEARMPAGTDRRTWEVLKVSAVGLSCRLNAMPVLAEAMAP